MNTKNQGSYSKVILNILSIISLFAIVVILQSFNQQPEAEKKEEEKDDYIFEIVEEQPEFPGGLEEMQEYLENNLEYPEEAKEAGIEGTVFVTFAVEPDGSISDTEVMRGIGSGCDEEAVRLVKNMPEWEPGQQRGEPVRVQLNLPVQFVLSNEEEND